jgi:hypothetical protein
VRRERLGCANVGRRREVAEAAWRDRPHVVRGTPGPRHVERVPLHRPQRRRQEQHRRRDDSSGHAEYCNPDETARQILEANPGSSVAETHSAAWLEGKRLLERAVAEHGNFAFETTLGGATMTQLLAGASDGASTCISGTRRSTAPRSTLRGCGPVYRVTATTSPNGTSAALRREPANLIERLPRLASLRVYDDSADADPATGAAPAPQLLLHAERGRVVHHCDLATAPER